MRILICNWKDPAHRAAGGAEVFTWEIARRWAADGHDVTLFASAVDGAPAREELDGISVVRAGGRLGVYRAARRFYQREGRGRFDVVLDEVNTRPFGCPLYVDDAPVVALIHQVARELWHCEMPAPVALLGRHVLEPRWLRRYRDIPVLTISESSRASLARYGIRDARVVPPGTDTPLTDHGQPKEEAPTALFTGRLTAGKRPGDVVAAFERVRAAVPNARLWIVGTGPLADHLARTKPEGVTLWGRVDEVRRDELMARAHALVVTSVREGWGLVVDEAAARGTRAIAYDVPGLRDSVPAANGVLVTPSVEALSAALRVHLPAWAAAPATGGWRGGAAAWDVVADRVLDELAGVVGRWAPVAA